MRGRVARSLRRSRNDRLAAGAQNALPGRLGILSTLCALTTSFLDGTEHKKAIGAWSGTIPTASAVGNLLGGLLSQVPGWRW